MTTITNGTLITLRVPEETRRALHIEGEMTMRLVTTADSTPTLRPGPDIPPEDAWAYTPEHEAAVESAGHSPAYQLTREELHWLIEAKDPEAALNEFYATHTPIIEDAPSHTWSHVHHRIPAIIATWWLE